ncbi:hypothetical protein GCM10023100_27920 [Actinocorallia cavernae]|uniref:Thiazolylpeptide-type bacteriocin n=2 Tax=Actinomycetes TaxID=1760 RepID=A0ABP8SMW2_9ACTN
MPPTAMLVAETVESEMIISEEFDKEDLEVLAGPVPTPGCGNGPACGICSA